MRARVLRVAAAMAVICLITGGVADAATKKKPARKPVRKTVVLHYSYNASESAHPVGQLCVYGQVAGQPPFVPCYDINPPSWARYMSIKSSDVSGRATPLSLFAQTTGIDTQSQETYFCGGTHNTRVAPGDAWSLSVDVVSADAACPGPALMGTVTITLSNLP